MNEHLDLIWNVNTNSSLFTNCNNFFNIINKHRINPKAIGTSITSRKQNSILTQPFTLSLYETFYLYSLNVVIFVNNNKDEIEHFKQMYSNRNEDFKYIVYIDLKKKKYFVNSGIKFGCDFLVYDNDPTITHSKYLVNCYTKEDKINFKTIISNERISVNTKKKLLYAFVNIADLSVEYLNIAWMLI